MSDPQSGDFFSAWSEWAASGEGTGSVSRRALEEAAQAHLAPEDPPRGTTATKSVTIESDPAFRGEPVTLLPGERFAGLEVRERLGGGGMATVYRAWDPEQEVEVALKLLHRGLVSDTRHLKRFRREARVASRRPVTTSKNSWLARS